MAALVSAIAPSVQPFAPGTEVLPGIRSVALPGHTPGHSGYEIRSGAARLLDMGDTAHSAIVSLADPGWAIEYDTDKLAGRAARGPERAREDDHGRAERERVGGGEQQPDRRHEDDEGEIEVMPGSSSMARRTHRSDRQGRRQLEGDCRGGVHPHEQDEHGERPAPGCGRRCGAYR